MVDKKLALGEIEIAPLAFMRGRTLSNSFIILDEAQNTTPMQMKMFLTRLGENSRMVINGDLSQTDLPRGVQSGLADALDVLRNVKDIAVVTCTALDAQGREVPDASPMVHFDCIGGGRIVGTGSDITDHVPVPCPDRRMWAGRISVAVRVSGAFRLLARAEDLDGAWLDVEAEQA